jgi:RNA polymerase sigma-70 factor, ECF subfamily
MHTCTEAAAFANATLPWSTLIAERSYLVRFARRRLQDPALAEDLVHDVFEAVASGRARYGATGAPRGWLLGILKHKIVDLVRERSGHLSLDVQDDDSDDSAPALELRCPQPEPDETAAQRERLQQTLLRIGLLPDSLRQVVELRLLADESTETVCDALGISEGNLFVRLHRARKMLAA